MGLTVQQLTDDYINKNGSSSKATKLTAMNSFKRIQKVLGKDLENVRVSDLRNPEKMVNELLENYSLNTTIQTLIYIKYLIRTLTDKDNLPNEYHDYLLELIDKRNEEVSEQRKTPSEELLGEDFDYMKMREKFLKYLNETGVRDSFSNARAMLILGLYLLQPPTRIGNYLNMTFKRKSKKLPKDRNYLLRNDDGSKFEFVFNKYKTAGHVGQGVRLPVVNKDLEGLINNYLKYHPNYKPNSKVGIEFLVNNNGKPLTQSNFTQVLKTVSKKVLGSPLSTNNYRHSFLTWFNSNNPSINEKKRIGRVLGQKNNVSRSDKYVRLDEDHKDLLPEYKDLPE
jgi:hypothetical protein